MKLLLDEDSQGKMLMSLLVTAGHDVETVTQAGIAGSDDPMVLAYARKTGRILLTRNGRDFLRLHMADNDHSGILIEHQEADPTKNMTSPQIVAALSKIEASGWSLQREIVSINAWR